MPDLDYRVRPAKSIQRKMLVEAFGRLDRFAPIRSYRYVGFGSYFFSDFVLVHRALGIDKMVSVEKDVEQQARFEANRPFRTIEMRFGHSNIVLPELPWNERTILWLDPTEKLNKELLADIALFFSRSVSGSVIAVTMNVDSRKLRHTPLEELIQNVGPELIPPGITKDELRSWGFADASRRIILNAVEEVLNRRNGGLPEPERLRFYDLFNFRYQDGARMLTVGGLICSESDRPRASACEFRRLDFAQAEPYVIQAPTLTFREVRSLDSRLPDAPSRLTSAARMLGIPRELVEQYRKVYRYYPTFSETEI